LKVLKDVGLVRDRREGRHVAYELSTSALWDPDARRWVDRLDAGLTPSGLSPAPEVPPQRREDIETYLL
jgi:DNA-binding transcriptional ArsR family regulator